MSMKAPSNPKPIFTVIDLFAGAGGLSDGFQNHGFNIIAYVEKDKYACETLFTRHIYWELRRRGEEDVYYNYIKGVISKDDLYHYYNFVNPVINREITDTTIQELVKSIQRNMKLLSVDKIDVFIGGPPCQAYSVVGRARDPYNMKLDSRNMLYRYYIELLKKFRPQIFLFENVPGIMSAGNGQLWKDVQTYFRKAGYEVDSKVLDASDFMVLQKRKRVIMIGWKRDLHHSYPVFNPTSHCYLVSDLLLDLPPLKPGERIDVGEYCSEPSKYLKETEIRTEKDILIQHTSRPINENDRKIYKIALNLWQKNRRRLRYEELPSFLKTHRNEKSFADRFKVVADDVPYSHTLVAHIAKDGHYYIHPNATQLRSLSVREAARLQSFSDNYKFEGPRTAQLIQIGNAVPPLLADKIADKIRSVMFLRKKYVWTKSPWRHIKVSGHVLSAPYYIADAAPLSRLSLWFTS